MVYSFFVYSEEFWWVEFEFDRFKNVLDSVGQSEYHNITLVDVKNLKPYSLFHP